MTAITRNESTAIDTSVVYRADRNPALVYLAGLAPATRRPAAQSLRVIAEILGATDYMSLPWGNLRFAHTQAVRAHLADHHPATTANRHMAALRGALKAAWQLGYMTAEDHLRAIDLKAIKGERVAAAESGRHLASGEIKGLLDACYDGSQSGLRDAAIIAVGYGCGLRRSEISGLDLADYDQDNGSLLIRHGKGNKQRLCYLPSGTAVALDAWLTVRGPAAGALFLSFRRGDHVTGQGLTDQAIYTILARCAERAGVAGFTPHDLRRTFAGDLMDTGEDLSTVQKMMGHSNVSTTARYDRRDGRTRKRAASKLHVPVRGQLI